MPSLQRAFTCDIAKLIYELLALGIDNTVALNISSLVSLLLFLILKILQIDFCPMAKNQAFSNVEENAWL